MDGPSDHWDEELSTYEGWAKYNRHYWLRDYRGFLQFFFSQMFTEPHSTKPREDCVGWGLDTTAETLIAAEFADELDEQTTRGLCRRIRCPVLVIQGTADAITGKGCGIALAEATGGQLALLEGAGHRQHVRDPVKVNLLLRDFAAPLAAPRRWVRGRARRKRALYISSPIGLGHAQRDVAIAGELRKLHPDLEIDWLAQHPVTNVPPRPTCGGYWWTAPPAPPTPPSTGTSPRATGSRSGWSTRWTPTIPCTIRSTCTAPAGS
jgi:hypothetical protein